MVGINLPSQQPVLSISYSRIPVTEERSAGEDSFDMMVEALKNEPASTPCVFSDQMGRGRTTTGMIGACLIKEIQITTELRSAGNLVGIFLYFYGFCFILSENYFAPFSAEYLLTNLFMKTNSFNKLFSNQQAASQPSYVLLILNQWPVFPLTSLPNWPFMMFC